MELEILVFFRYFGILAQVVSEMKVKMASLSLATFALSIGRVVCHINVFIVKPTIAKMLRFDIILY